MPKSSVQISEEKARKIAVGATVAGVLLIVFLVVVLIIQFVQISVKKSEQAELEETIAQYEQMIEENQDDLEFYQSQQGLYYLARKNGWK